MSSRKRKQTKPRIRVKAGSRRIQDDIFEHAIDTLISSAGRLDKAVADLTADKQPAVPEKPKAATIPVSTFVHEHGKPTKITHEIAAEYPTRFADPVDEAPSEADPSVAAIAAALRRQPAQECPSAAPATDAQLDQRLAASVKEPRHHIAQRDEDGKATSTKKEAALAQKKAETTDGLKHDVAGAHIPGWLKDMSEILLALCAIVLFIVLVVVAIYSVDAGIAGLVIWQKLSPLLSVHS
jgi:hypothetical protein